MCSLLTNYVEFTMRVRTWGRYDVEMTSYLYGTFGRSSQNKGGLRLKKWSYERGIFNLLLFSYFECFNYNLIKINLYFFLVAYL